MTGHPQRVVGLALICLFFIVLAWTYGLVLPPFENLDEVEHFSAIRYVAETGSLPVHDPAIQEQYHYRQEASQPPLYYLLMGGLARLLGLPTKDTNAYLVNNPFVACGPSDQPYNRHALYHNPSREAPPWHGALLTLHLLRTLSSLLQVVTVAGVYAIARLILPRRPSVALLATALTAFNPQFLLVASGVNNDNLGTPLATLGVYLTLRTRQRGLTWKHSIGLGLLTGLAALSKLSGLLLLGLIGVVLLEALWRSHRPQYPMPNVQYPQIIAHGLLIATLTTAVCGWWFWRNGQLYGDPTALAPMLDLVGRRPSSALPLNESGLMFRSFWGQLACTFFGNWLYLFFGLLMAVGLIGLLWGLRNEGRQNRLGMLFLALWFGITFAGWLRWGAITAATGGRLLFPAIASTSTLLAYGLLSFWPVAWRGRVAAVATALLALVASATLLWELRPLFALPRTYAEADAPHISFPLQAIFHSPPSEDAQQIRLLGYDAQVQGKSPALDVTLYWQALAPIAQDYALAIQLTSPIPGDDSLRFNYNTWPGHGNYPTSAWSPDRVVADHYRFRLPTSDAPTQAWQLLVAFYELESGARLPVLLDDQDVGDSLVLTTLRVPDRSPTCPGEGVLAKPVSFELAEEKISLTAATADILIKGNPQIKVSLCWKSLAPVPLDYTVFVHLYDENGALIATGDGPPMDGAFPTRLWQPGDVVADEHSIYYYLWPPEKWDSCRVGVGLYDPLSGERLKAVQDGRPLPDGVVFLDIGS